MAVHQRQFVSGNGDEMRLDQAVKTSTELTPLQDCLHIDAPGRFDNASSSSSSSSFLHKFDVESICVGCSETILDQALLNVGDKCFHALCLRCELCSIQLHQELTCFVREDMIYCKSCYNRQFGIKCSGCARQIQATDWVRRAREFVYHLACFACEQCKRQLSTGEEFALQDCRLLCKQHFIELVEGESGQSKSKTKRVRTTFAEDQLSVLQTHFQIDSNPDGSDLERIANMTGLSKRVTQVWFQNSRARQKKYQGMKSGSGKSRGTVSSSGRSSSERGGSKSPDSQDQDDGGMMFPTSVMTSAEDAMVDQQQQQHSLLGLSIDTSVRMMHDDLYDSGD